MALALPTLTAEAAADPLRSDDAEAAADPLRSDDGRRMRRRANIITWTDRSRSPSAVSERDTGREVRNTNSYT